MSTVNEEVYVANFKDYRFLQVFYPTRGIIAWYDRTTKEIKALPGADDPRYVQTDRCGLPTASTWCSRARKPGTPTRRGGR